MREHKGRAKGIAKGKVKGIDTELDYSQLQMLRAGLRA